ncbi:MAG: Scr1 family TA system antitoxin-like transcriptional regulator, partial [Acidimicrobiia bacterium]|nr:Scr1 family TA system antitoxin-like transcriptional regulator [Acidimicrobiia bacterium]
MADSASPSSTSPTVARWEFARRIKVRRDDLDLRIDAVAKHLGFSRNFYSAVENERSMLAVDKLEPLFDLLEFEDQDRDELRELNEAARRRSELGGLAGDEAGERFIGLEQGASRIRTFESFVWPGLFQLPEYAAAVFGADPRRARAAIDDYVSLRIRRQEKVFGKGTPVQAVVSEAVVMQQWGSRDLQHEQLRHILSLLEHGEVELRVLRFDTVPGM